MDRDNPYDPGGPEEWPVGAPDDGDDGDDTWQVTSDAEPVEEDAWDTFSEGSPTWGVDGGDDEGLDVGYLTEQHPQAAEVGVTDTAAGVQFFG